MTTTEFLRPRFRGPRFEEGAIPLEVLQDLAVLQEMVIEVAKWRFLQQRPDRRRSPRGFSRGLSLKLTAMEHGSVIPVIGLVTEDNHLREILPANLTCLEDARDSILAAIDAANGSQPPTAHLPAECLAYFDRFGRGLREDESIEITSPARHEPVRLTREVRRRLVSASRIRQTTEEVTLRGLVPEANQEALTFELRLASGGKVTGPLATQHLDTIFAAFNGFQSGVRVAIEGIGKFDHQRRLLALESVEHISLLDPLDVASRLDDLRELRDGWLDGKGRSPADDGLDWLASAFEQSFPEDLPLPHLYPTREGGIQAEWSLGGHEITIDIDLFAKHGTWHVLELATEAEEARSLDLSIDDGWRSLAARIREIAGCVP